MRRRNITSQALSATDIIYEDDQIIVLNKPSGLLVLPDRYDPTVPNLIGLLREKLGQMYVVHRIDKETSGTIIFAKTEGAHRLLNDQFKSRMTEKIYQAICVGEAGTKEGTIDLPLSENPNRKAGMRIDESRGKSAVTRYKVLEEFEGYSFVEARPETGRTHQIRIHLSAVNLPILGDSLYGGGERFMLSHIKPSYRSKGIEKPLLSRTALHALRIVIEHPATQQRIAFEATLPKDMKIVLNYLRRFKQR